MTRLDEPTLQCDRCKSITKDLKEMAQYRTLSHYPISGKIEWDLCPNCWDQFLKDFIEDNA